MMVLDGVEMLDVREAARLTGRTPETIRRWVWAGRIRHVKQGNRLLVPRAELVSAGAQESDGHDLRGWLEAAKPRTSRGRSAADLVLEDRRLRSGGDGGR